MRKNLFFTFLFSLLVFNSSFSQCPADQIAVVVTIIPDTYPNETSWELKDASGNLLGSGLVNGDTVCVDTSLCLKFTIYDSFGDGICCAYGNGSYTVTYGGNTVATGGAFLSSESAEFGNCPPGSSCFNPDTVALGTYNTTPPDHWYAFIPSITGQYYINTCSSSCDTKIWVYDYCLGLNPSPGNAGTIYYNDNNCGLQSEVFPQLVAGNTYYIRIGGNGPACDASNIQWTLSYQGPISGCMDPTACNYNPLATVTDTCYYPGNPNCPDGPDLTVIENDILNSLYLDQIGAQNCMVLEGCLTGYGQRDIIRFTTHIQNIGTQDYYIGDPAANPGQFTWDACHGHYHYVGYAEYVLYDSAGTSIPVGFKNGFCVLDLECDNGGTYQYGCSNMGISVGCGDIYDASLDCQWIDITNVPEGHYTLVVRVNWDQSPDALGRVETDYSNNWAQACIQITRTPVLNFSVDPTCSTYVDCAGIPFGNSMPDCNGVCAGTALIGDLDLDTVLTVPDAQAYLVHTANGTLTPASCNDVNGDGEITVADAAFVSSCATYGDDHIHTGGAHHDHCNFPATDIVNINHLDGLRIGTVDFANNYLDVLVRNPDNTIIAYEFITSGIVVDSVATLVSPSDYPCDIAWNPNGHVSCVSYIDSSVNKNFAPVALCRIWFSAITANQICIDSIVDIVNQNHEKTLTAIEGSCAVATETQDVVNPLDVKVHPNPFSDYTIFDFDGQGEKYKLEILDMTGKVLRTYEAGNGSIEIRRENLSSGLYMYRLTGKYHQTGKLLIY